MVAKNNEQPANPEMTENKAELLQKAIELLAPRKDQGRFRDDDIRQSKKSQIQKIIEHYQADQRLKWTDFRNDLREIAARAEALRQRIARAEAVSISLLGTNGLLRALFRTKRDADGQPIQEAGGWRDEYCKGAAESEILDLLELISSIAQQESQNLEIGTGKSAFYPESDHAQNELVRDCLRLFEIYRPGEASTTEGGDFRVFTSRLYEIATGKPEVNMIRRVRRVLKDYREVQSDYRKNRIDIIAEMNIRRGKFYG